MEEQPAIVIDMGSSMVRMGLAGEDQPSKEFPSIVATGSSDVVGNEALSRSHELHLHHAVTHGIWDADSVEKLLHYSLKPQQAHPVWMSGAAHDSKKNRETMTQLLFEKFQVPGAFIHDSCVSSLYSHGRCSGLSVCLGGGVTQLVPIWEGHLIKEGVTRTDFGGEDLDQILGGLLRHRGGLDFDLKDVAHQQVLRHIKESHCFVAPNSCWMLSHHQQQHTKDTVEYTMPDGMSVAIGVNELFMCPESLFHPNGIHQMIYDSIMKCDVDLRQDMWNNICISGGCSMLPGFLHRLESELTSLKGSNPGSVRVVGTPERKCSVWIGGSIIASLSTFQSMWITPQQYDESGPSIIHKRSFC